MHILVQHWSRELNPNFPYNNFSVKPMTPLSSLNKKPTVWWTISPDAEMQHRELQSRDICSSEDEIDSWGSCQHCWHWQVLWQVHSQKQVPTQPAQKGTSSFEVKVSFEYIRSYLFSQYLLGKWSHLSFLAVRWSWCLSLQEAGSQRPFPSCLFGMSFLLGPFLPSSYPLTSNWMGVATAKHGSLPSTSACPSLSYT